MEDILSFHRKAKGKVRIELSVPIANHNDLSLTYTPGVAVPAQTIAEHSDEVWNLTGRGNRVAIVTDGSAVLGLGNVGPDAALPVMEGKAALMKQFANIDAFPICLATQETEEVIAAIKAIAPSFGGINIEDIAAPRCFEIEEVLKRELDIPVFHDDQHGTAVVVLAGLMNALKVQNHVMLSRAERVETGSDDERSEESVQSHETKRVSKHENPKIVLSGAGAAGTAITRMLLAQGFTNILVCDRHGVIHRNRKDLNASKTFLAAATNPDNAEGELKDALKNADVFIGVSAPGLLTKKMIELMNTDPIIFALANPDPEIMPDEAKKAGAAIIATGRSDFPNQVNNVLVFPGIFRGALDARASDITEAMKLAAANALAACVSEPTAEKILPDPLDKDIAKKVAEAVMSCG